MRRLVGKEEEEEAQGKDGEVGERRGKGGMVGAMAKDREGD